MIEVPDGIISTEKTIRRHIVDTPAGNNATRVRNLFFRIGLYTMSEADGGPGYSYIFDTQEAADLFEKLFNFLCDEGMGKDWNEE